MDSLCSGSDSKWWPPEWAYNSETLFLRQADKCPCPRRKGILSSGGTTPLILNLGTRWRCVVSLTLWLLCARLTSVPVHVVKAYWVVEVQLHSFLTSALDGDVWLASRFGCFATGTNWIGGWVATRAGLEKLWRREQSLAAARNWTTIPRSSASYPSHYTGCSTGKVPGLKQFCVCVAGKVPAFWRHNDVLAVVLGPYRQFILQVLEIFRHLLMLSVFLTMAQESSVAA